MGATSGGVTVQQKDSTVVYPMGRELEVLYARAVASASESSNTEHVTTSVRLTDMSTSLSPSSRPDTSSTLVAIRSTFHPASLDQVDVRKGPYCT